MVLETQAKNNESIMYRTEGAKVPAHVKDLGLAERGMNRIEWAERDMPVLRAIRERFEREKPSRGHAHVGLPARHRRDRQPGAHPAGRRRRPRAVRLQPALDPGRRGRGPRGQDFGIPIYAIKGEDNDTYYKHIAAALEHQPHITMDDGADLVSAMIFIALDRLDDVHPEVPRLGGQHLRRRAPGAAQRRRRQHGGDDHRRHPPAGDGEGRRAQVPGHRRQRARDQAHLRQPLRHRPEHASTASSAPPTCCWPARSSWSAATAGAARASPCAPRGMGADVIVTEVDPMRALEAAMDGFEVMPMAEAAKIGDIFITVTGNINVHRPPALRGDEGRRDRGNSGHFNVEINIPALRRPEPTSVAAPSATSSTSSR